jgi:DNA polymerase I-like protein with 3'-5' exonuclease and polymerase domains
MNIITIDFETYYDKDYSLSKMSTEDYIKSPLFEVILVAAKVDDGPTMWVSGKKAAKWLDELNIPNSAVVCHNAMFDATILQERFSLRPKFIFDTISMAQAHLRPFTTGVSLAKCLEYCDFDGLRKGTAVHNMIGRNLASLSRSELLDYADYCCTDVEGTYRLFHHLKPLFPRSEFAIMDLTHRMYLDPVLELDANLLAETLQQEQATKAQFLRSMANYASKDELMSNEKFAAVLQRMGVDPPVKVSPTTGKLTWAFAKGDPEFRAMQEEYEDDDLVTALIDARLGVKSTIGETRTQRLLDIAIRFGKLRVPLNYYAAHTGRYGGTQKINMQNPPRIKKSLGRRQIRYAMRAPKGHVVMGADLSQIEARIVAWLAGEHPLVQAFAAGSDVYSLFATQAYNQSTVKGRSQEDDARRFVGKTCILGLGYGMGYVKLKNTLGKDGVKVDETESQRLVNVYRTTYSNIPRLWANLDNTLPRIASGSGKVIIAPPGGEQVCQSARNMVILPNGMPLYYNDLRRSDTGDWIYTYGRETRKLFGGKLTENIVQALARIVVMDNMLTIHKELGLKPVLQVHDELDYVVLERDADTYADEIRRIMSVAPSWAPGLPVAVEVAWGPTFGDCK